MYDLAEGYRVDVFAEQSRFGGEDLVELWTSEGVLDLEEARRRVSEVHLVATSPDSHLAAVSSAYLRHNAQLRMDLWYYRIFVAPAHRLSNVAMTIGCRGRDLLEERYDSGAEVRAGGIVWEIENDGVKRRFNGAVLLPPDFVFIGENARGDHVRVHYFPGARAPLPQGST